MRASDILRLAWKNLKEEKKKSWLTGFVVLLINSILCFLLIAGTSLYKTRVGASENYVYEKGISTTIGSPNAIIDDNSYKNICSNLGDRKIKTICSVKESACFYDLDYLSISENDKQKMNEGPYILVDESLSSSYPIGSQVSVLGISFEVFRYVKGFGEEKIGSLSFAIRHFPQGANPLQIDLAPDIDNIQREIEELNQFNQRISRKGYNVTTSISAFYQAKKAASLLLGIFVFLSVLILVLTFAVLANSIRISEDWNHKNFALYKSLGRKSKDRLGVFVIQISIIYFLSGLLSSLFRILLKRPICSFVRFIFPIAVDVFLDFPLTLSQTSFVYPFFIPLVVFASFVILTLCFSCRLRKKKLSSSPISLLKEEEQND